MKKLIAALFGLIVFWLYQVGRGLRDRLDGLVECGMTR